MNETIIVFIKLNNSLDNRKNKSLFFPGNFESHWRITSKYVKTNQNVIVTVTDDEYWKRILSNSLKDYDSTLIHRDTVNWEE